MGKYLAESFAIAKLFSSYNLMEFTNLDPEEYQVKLDDPSEPHPYIALEAGHSVLEDDDQIQFNIALERARLEEMGLAPFMIDACMKSQFGAHYDAKDLNALRYESDYIAREMKRIGMLPFTEVQKLYDYSITDAEEIETTKAETETEAVASVDAEGDCEHRGQSHTEEEGSPQETACCAVI